MTHNLDFFWKQIMKCVDLWEIKKKKAIVWIENVMQGSKIRRKPGFIAPQWYKCSHPVMKELWNSHLLWKRWGETHGQMIISQCGYVTFASTSFIKASMSTTNDQAAKSCVAMVTAVLATHLTRYRLLMSLLLKGKATHSQALTATQLFVCSFLKWIVDAVSCWGW